MTVSTSEEKNVALVHRKPENILVCFDRDEFLEYFWDHTEDNFSKWEIAALLKGMRKLAKNPDRTDVAVWVSVHNLVWYTYFRIAGCDLPSDSEKVAIAKIVSQLPRSARADLWDNLIDTYLGG